MVKEIVSSEKQNQVARHILQSFEWGEFKKTTSGVAKVWRFGEYQGENLSAVYQLFIHRLPHFPLTIGYLPRSVFPSAEALLKIKEICQKEKAIYLKIDPFQGSGIRDQGSGITNGRPIQPRHTIYVDLTASEEVFLSRMHPKTRYNIGLAQRKGVEIKLENNNAGLEAFIKILAETEKRQKFYAHNGAYYQHLWEILGGAKMVYILNAYLGKEAIASILLFRFKDFLYYPYGGSDYEHRQFMAPQLLHFEAMKLGKELGCKTYDLWGSYQNTPTESDPWWGFYRLKSGLGGKEVDFPETVDIPLSPLYYPAQISDQLRWLFLRIKS